MPACQYNIDIVWFNLSGSKIHISHQIFDVIGMNNNKIIAIMQNNNKHKHVQHPDIQLTELSF